MQNTLRIKKRSSSLHNPMCSHMPSSPWPLPALSFSLKFAMTF